MRPSASPISATADKGLREKAASRIQLDAAMATLQQSRAHFAAEMDGLDAEAAKKQANHDAWRAGQQARSGRQSTSSEAHLEAWRHTISSKLSARDNQRYGPEVHVACNEKAQSL